ncbi:MAG TPA: MBL fold metallo-hydrolase [Steroidobacteraceae bacterium]|nr:MBL fold metallo-hydrolase [Steroidobacteraceae bacterium]
MATVPWTRRRLLIRALQLGAASVLPAAFATRALAQRSGGGLATQGRPEPAPVRPGTWLVLLGTRGGPGIDLTRAQSSSAVVVDGRPYLVDCGYGTLRQLVASHVGYLGLSTIFFTHLHDDHTADLAALMSFQWTNGKTSPTDAYGPYGTARMVQAAMDFFRANVEIRTVDEGRTVDAERQFRGHDVPATAEPVRIFADERVRVSAVENTHYPARVIARIPDRSLALRFESRQRSIVFSGDTAYSANVVKLARGADVFVCEVMDQSVLDQMRRRAQAAAAAGNPNNLFRHVAETHCSPADVARMATEANVKSVVLNHLLLGPALPDGLAYPVSTVIDDVRHGFSGEVILGEDSMVL